MSVTSHDRSEEADSHPEFDPSLRRVAFLIHDLQPGGAERVLVSYLEHFRSIRPTLFLVRRPPRHKPSLAAAVPAVDLGSRSRVAWTAPVMLLRKAARLDRHLRAAGVETVSTFLHKSHVIALVLKLYRPELRVVVNVHETPSSHIPEHFGVVGRAGMRLVTRRLLPTADRIVAVSEGVADDLVTRFGVRRNHIVVVENPIFADSIREAATAADGAAEVTRAESDGSKLHFIAVGRLVPLKGVDVLIDAFAMLPETLAARLTIVGDGPERAALEERTRARGVAGRVRFTGYDPNPWRHMAESDVVVLASRTEALPNVISEALVLGRPVVATDCAPGVREYLSGGAGLLIRPDDVSALADGLRRVASDPELRAEMAAAARAAGDRFDGAEQVRRYEDVLLSVASHDGSTR